MFMNNQMKLEISSEILGVDKEVLRRLHVILTAINIFSDLDATQFHQYAVVTAQLLTEKYGFWPMSPTVHKVLIHGQEIISNAVLPTGKVYSVVGRRQGKVLDAVGMDEDEKTFLVKAQIPVAESHGFANEIRKTTSGQANPNLRFSHFEIIDGDPYYNVEEAIDSDDEEDESINTDSAKRASKLRIEVRKRKGLKVNEQVVVHAEKQRTHKNK